MAHSTIILDTRSRKKDGTYPIKIRVTHRSEFYINLDIDVSNTQWEVIESKETRTKLGVVKNHPLARQYNSLIAIRKAEIDKKLIFITANDTIAKMDNKQLKNYLMQDGIEQQAYLFKEHYEKYCLAKTRATTLSTFRNTYIKISKFCNIDNLSFTQMGYEWVKEFDKFMGENGLSVNARGVYLRNIRAIFNDAIKCDYVSLSDYPFRKFTIKTEKTRKRSLTVEQLRTLRDYNCQEYQEKYRDIFMLIFYLHGINLVDLLHLKEINNGRIEFARSKTGRLYSIKVEPEAMEIIEKYRGKDYLLDIMDRYTDYRDFTHRMNTALKAIGELEMVDNATRTKKNAKKITPEFPGLSSYWARHTVATLAAKLKIPKDTIAAMLGHSQNTVTDIYIDYDLSLIDEANRKVIDYVLNGKSEQD